VANLINPHVTCVCALFLECGPDNKFRDYIHFEFSKTSACRHRGFDLTENSAYQSAERRLWLSTPCPKKHVTTFSTKQYVDYGEIGHFFVFCDFPR